MELSDFHIGLEFVASAGFRWRCTDVGTRTVLAIQIDRRDPNWYQGPPYIGNMPANHGCFCRTRNAASYAHFWVT